MAAERAEGEVAVRLMPQMLFPTLLFTTDLDDADRMNAEMAAALRARRAADEEPREYSNVPALGGWHSDAGLHEDPAFAPLVAQIGAAGRQLSRSLRYHPDYELAIDGMWAIVNPPGSFNRAHVHSGCLWSGACYVQVPDRAGTIGFYNPSIAAVTTPPRFDPQTDPHGASVVEAHAEPKEGRMLLFAPWLVHWVEPNLSDATGPAAERICISFNLSQRKKRG